MLIYKITFQTTDQMMDDSFYFKRIPSADEIVNTIQFNKNLAPHQFHFWYEQMKDQVHSLAPIILNFQESLTLAMETGRSGDCWHLSMHRIIVIEN